MANDEDGPIRKVSPVELSMKQHSQVSVEPLLIENYATHKKNPKHTVIALDNANQAEVIESIKNATEIESIKEVENETSDVLGSEFADSEDSSSTQTFTETLPAGFQADDEEQEIAHLAATLEKVKLSIEKQIERRSSYNERTVPSASVQSERSMASAKWEAPNFPAADWENLNGELQSNANTEEPKKYVRICFEFRDQGYCRFEPNCKFSHSFQRKKCWNFDHEKRCRFGKYCRFIHDGAVTPIEGRISGPKSSGPFMGSQSHMSTAPVPRGPYGPTGMQPTYDPYQTHFQPAEYRDPYQAYAYGNNVQLQDSTDFFIDALNHIPQPSELRGYPPYRIRGLHHSARPSEFGPRSSQPNQHYVAYAKDDRPEFELSNQNRGTMKPCFNFTTKGTCEFGNRCRYKHIREPRYI